MRWLVGVILACYSVVAYAQLAPAWVVPAAAHTPGVGGTYWYTDLSIHNPHRYDLSVDVYLLPSERDNTEVPVLDLVIYPWETVNLWDVLDVFQWPGTGALLVVADEAEMGDCSNSACDFLVSSRTYTPDPLTAVGEFGQGIPGLAVWEGIDWGTYGYACGIMSDSYFRCNWGVVSWTPDPVTVAVDVQDASGNILATHRVVVAPFGHIQRRLGEEVTGGSLVFYLVAGPSDALIFPYASVVNNATGDPTFLAAKPSVVGVSTAKALEGGIPALPEVLKKIKMDRAWLQSLKRPFSK